MGASLTVKDHGFDAFFRRAREIQEARVKVGVLSETEKGGAEVAGGGLTLAELAAVLEFGTEDGHIPARPFMRSTFDEKQPELAEMAKGLVLQVMEGKMPVARALGLMGAKLAGDVKTKITTGAGIPPPNAPSTILAKMGGAARAVAGSGARGFGRALAQVGRAASVRPLVDTGRLLGAITWQVIMGGARDKE